MVIGQEPVSKPSITLGYDTRDFDQATIDRITESLSFHARVSVGHVQRFSDDPAALGLIFDLLMSTLTSIGANALYDALRPARERTNRLRLRLRLWSQGDGGNRRVLEAHIDVSDAESFSRAVDSVSGLLDRHGGMFAYSAERDEWDDTS